MQPAIIIQILYFPVKFSNSVGCKREESEWWGGGVQERSVLSIYSTPVWSWRVVEAEGCLGRLIAYVIFLAGTFITRGCQRSSGYCSKLFSSHHC